jgi:hypothetical protein
MEKVRVDIDKNPTWAIIMILVLIATMFFLIMGEAIGFSSSLGYIAWFLGIAVLILYDDTSVYVTDDMILIHRLFFGPVILKKEEITETRVKRNYNPTVRFILYLMMILVSGYLAYDAFFDIQKDMGSNIPLYALLLGFVSNLMLILFYLALFYLLIKRLQHPDLLQVKTKNRTVKFYPNNPDEFEEIVTCRKTDMKKTAL